jgi:hypothetical protein
MGFLNLYYYVGRKETEGVDRIETDDFDMAHDVVESDEA